jgi:hypothetical protein
MGKYSPRGTILLSILYLMFIQCWPDSYALCSDPNQKILVQCLTEVAVLLHKTLHQAPVAYPNDLLGLTI